MPSKSSTLDRDRANPPRPNTPELLGADERTRAAKKAVTTRRRHQEARRADRLAEIRVQIANGTLVVRHMTAAERERHPKPPARRGHGTKAAATRRADRKRDRCAASSRARRRERKRWHRLRRRAGRRGG